MARTQEPSIAVNIPINAPPHVYAAAAEQCLEWGRPDDALKVSDLGLERHPSYAGLRLFRAEALLLNGRAEQGEEDLRAVLVAEPQHPRALKQLARLLVVQRRFREALPILERAEFILISDQDIPQWLQIAEQGALQEPETPLQPLELPVQVPDLSERCSELLETPGVLAVSISDGTRERHCGAEWDHHANAVTRLREMETQMAGVLAEAGFGSLVDAYVHMGETTVMSHHRAKMTVCVAADSRTREGLIAWQCRKALGEASE